MCALCEKQVKTKETSDSLTPAADCSSCRMTRRPCLCSSHRSPGEERKQRNRVRFKERLVHESWMSRCPQSTTLVLKQASSPRVLSIPNHLFLCWWTSNSKLRECPEQSHSVEILVGEVRFSYSKPDSSGKLIYWLSHNLFLVGCYLCLPYQN